MGSYSCKKGSSIIETFFQVIALLSPLVMTIVFAVILFENRDQISIVSSFGGWCTGWVFFLIGSIIAPVVLLIMRFTSWSADNINARTAATAVAVVVAICSIIVFVNYSKLDPNFDPTTFVTFEVTGKTTQSHGGTVDTFYESDITFIITNNSKYKINRIGGEMVFYDGENKAASREIILTEVYEAEQSFTKTLHFSEINNNSIYKIPYENLVITYRIYSMMFNGYYEEYRFNGKPVTIKQGKSNSTNSTNNSSSESSNNPSGNSSSEFRDVTNYSLPDGGTLLKWLHHDVNENVLIPDNGYYHIRYTNNCVCDTSDYSESYIGSSVFFSVNNAYIDTIIDDFREELSSNGWICIFERSYGYEYKKGKTHIRFNSVHDSIVSAGTYEYHDNNYFFNYYAFNED